MSQSNQVFCTAFEGTSRLAAGELPAVVRAVKQVLDQREEAQILIFDDATSRPIDVDFRGTAAEVLERLAAPVAAPAEAEPPRGPGRPKLGVVAREVTLLPRHWDWLGRQPGGASVALRKLVEEARRAGSSRDVVRQAQEAAYRFMSAMAGNQPGFEEATRALFAGARTRFDELVEPWPVDVRDYTLKLAAAAFPQPAEGAGA